MAFTRDSPGFSSLLSTPVHSAYTPTQILTYLNHINFPLPLTFPRTPETLTLIHRLQITTIPYDNLSLHYNPSHDNSIHPQDLFNKFITPPLGSRGRGGYCFENATFWLNILRGLGFTAYASQARIRLRDGPVPRGDFVGPRHVIIIVHFADGQRWSSDVGFGGDGPTSPLRLEERESGGTGDKGAVTNLGSQQVRISRGQFPGTMDAGRNQFWFYEYRNGKEVEWNRYYAFADVEAGSWDLEAANWWVQTHPESFQRKGLLLVKFLREKGGDVVNGEGEGVKQVEVVGKMMLADGVVKMNMGGKTEVVKVCRTEAERIGALKEHFGIWLTDEEREGIRGFETELRG
ncbi:hypothetical protein B9Z65_7190 [Elsinoe australis]|uniref:Uncharacterized protein n=1 Tax=Elsinoe australis TaxID=40998 RepID=A0A2P7Z636_9PEZI|nr:hypothetical protein B9Z65_7190 [Elsinoe australis]